MSSSSCKIFTAMILVMILDYALISPSHCSPGQASFSPTPIITKSSQPRKNGFVAPLIYRTSPDSPFYNPHETHEDIIRENIRISNDRMSYFRERVTRKSYVGAVAPITRDFTMPYDIGTPKFRTYAIPDTASQLIWLQCQPCTHCFEQRTPIFDPRNSSTFKKLSCDDVECIYDHQFGCDKLSGDCSYSFVYEDETSSKGIVSQETITISESVFPNIIIGCGYNNSDPISLGMPGVLGLRDSSVDSTVSLISQLDENSFSYCQNRDRSAGWIRFGSSAKFQGPRTPLVPNKFGNYLLNLKGISVEDYQLNISADIFRFVDGNPRTGFVIDSGSSFTYLHPVAHDALVKRIEEVLMDYETVSILEFKLCYDVVKYPGLDGRFPRIKLLLEKLTLWLSNKNAWVLLYRKYQCLTILRNAHKYDRSVLGMYQQRGMNVGYDLTRDQLWMKYVTPCTLY